MDPVGSWSAYAASYTRLTNAGSFQNSTGELHHHLAATGGGAQGPTPSSTSQLLLQAAHTNSSFSPPTPSPFSPAGFLSPPPVAYDPVFSPLFHQKAHYGSLQHRPPLKQPPENDYPRENFNQIPPPNFFEQTPNNPSITWSQNNPQMPSPFGVLPHESVVPSAPHGPSPTKPYNDSFSPPFGGSSPLNHLNPPMAEYKGSYIEPKKRVPSPPLTKNPPAAVPPTPFFQQGFPPPPVDSNPIFKQADYAIKPFPNGNTQQSCIVASPQTTPALPSKDYRIPQPLRPQFPSRVERDNRTFSSPAVSPTGLNPPSEQVSKPFEHSESRSEGDSQSSPISFALMDGQRNFQNSNGLSTKVRPQQQFPNLTPQGYRYPIAGVPPEVDFQRNKSIESYAPNPLSNVPPDCSGGAASKRPSPLQAHTSPNGQSNSPVYPMYSSAITGIPTSPPPPPLLEACYPKQTPDAPPLDVTLPRNPVGYSSVITRADKPVVDQRFERQDYCKQQWDRKYPNYEPQNAVRPDRQQCFDGQQVTLQDLSSCRGDPMSLVKTLQQSQPDKVVEEKTKKRSRSPERVSEQEFVPRVPPPAHHNVNQPNQSGYFDYERWNIPPPPGKVFTSPPVSFPPNQPSIPSNFVGNHQHQGLMVPHPGPPLPYFPPFHVPPSSHPPETPSAETNEAPPHKEVHPKVIVPNIEEELGFLIENDDENGDEKLLPKKILAPNPNSGFMSSYMKFLQGEKETSPPPNPRPIRRPTWIKPSGQLSQAPLIPPIEIPKEFPSDPQDDPRYFPLPKTSDARSFDSSDSDFSDDGFGFFRKSTKKDKGEVSKVLNEISKVSEKVRPVSKPKSKPPSKSKKKSSPSTQEGDVPKPNGAKRDAMKRKKKPIKLGCENDQEGGASDNLDSDADSLWKQKEPTIESSKDDSKRRKTKTLQNSRKKPRVACKTCEEEVQIESSGQGVKGKKKGEILQGTKKDAVPQAFNIGDYVVLKSDTSQLHPLVWRIKEKSMLQKYQHFVRNGVSFYSNLPCFTGWSPESKPLFESLSVKVVSHSKLEVVIKVTDGRFPWISDDEKCSIDQHIQENPKFQDQFEVYIQTLLSQALDSNFLMEIFQEKDEYFLGNVRAVDELTEGLKRQLCSLLKWDSDLVTAIEGRASYRLQSRGGALSGQCRCGNRLSSIVTLTGDPYHPHTLAPTGDKRPPLDIMVCERCLRGFQLVHLLSHQKWCLYEACNEKVVAKKEAEPDKDTTVVLNELLADDLWLNELLREVTTTWRMAERLMRELEGGARQ